MELQIDAWMIARTALEFFIALCIKTFIENGQVNWKTFKEAYVPSWSRTPSKVQQRLAAIDQTRKLVSDL